jgi:molecular chaperone Hsp33
MMSTSETHKVGEGVTVAAGDLILPFQVNQLGCRGRIVRLGETVSDILNRHDYPEPVARLLAEALALTALLGAALKMEGKLSLQTKSDGALDMLVVDYMSTGTLRAYAHFDAALIAAHDPVLENATARLLGTGHMALTIDQGKYTERYQGIVPLSNTSLSEAAHTYFNQSEQIPTNIYLAAGLLVSAGPQGAVNGWQAGGMMIQYLPEAGGIALHKDLPSGEDGEEEVDLEEDDRWTRAKALMNTIEAHELLDPTLELERLVYRFFNEDGVHVFDPVSLKRGCQCSSEKVEQMLGQFSADDINAMIKNGKIGVVCEFCSQSYTFDPEKFLK